MNHCNQVWTFYSLQFTPVGDLRLLNLHGCKGEVLLKRQEPPNTCLDSGTLISRQKEKATGIHEEGAMLASQEKKKLATGERKPAILHEKVS
jgi:hypothetical protein